MGVTVAMMTILALAGSGIYLGLKTMENYNPGKGKIQKDLKVLKDEIEGYVKDLVPFTEEEMMQLSLSTSKKKSSKGVTSTTKGIFNSIYHEPLIAWVHRQYVSSKDNALIYAKISNHEFIYREKKNQVDLVIDEELIGQIGPDGALYPFKGKNPIAHIKKAAGALGLPIYVGEKEVGRLTNTNKATGNNPRVFQVVGAMDEKEKKLFLGISIFEIIKLQVKNSNT